MITLFILMILFSVVFNMVQLYFMRKDILKIKQQLISILLDQVKEAERRLDELVEVNDQDLNPTPLHELGIDVSKI